MKTRNYFGFKCSIYADRIRLAGLHLGKKAMTWYKWSYESKNEQVSGILFFHELLIRFDDYEVDMCYLTNMLNIQQKSSVKEYEIEFLKTKEIVEYFYNFVFKEEILAHNFICGL